ncbi:MAG: MMPL family transporter, partial [candidate division Zixibacteria bacterium]|nr:MMPL family transporter [candidate division Zixibacteria bacterium]
PLILSFSLMYSIHHLACVYRSRVRVGERSQVIRCWQLLVIPNLLCGVTTWLGFMSLGISPLPGIREVGIFVGCGVIISTVLANFFLPALVILVAGGSGQAGERIGTGFVARFIPKLQAAILPRPGLFVTAIVGLTLLAGLGIQRLRVESNHLEYLSRDTDVTESFKFIDANFGGVLPLEILVDIPERRAAEAIAQIVGFEDSVRALEGIGSVISAADFIVEAELSKPKRAASLRPPLYLDKGLVPAQLWDLVTRPAAGGSYVDRTDSIITVRISCRAHLLGSDQLQLTLDKTQDLLDRHLPNYQTTITGIAAYFARVEDFVVSTQINSFAVALGVVVLLLSILGGCWRTALAVIAVNLVPVIVVLGTMGWLSVPLDISTVMIAAIVLGIVVDDTIHLIYRYRKERQAGAEVETGLQTAFREVGLPVLTTTIILVIGFASLLPARFVPTVYFGGLSALTILIAAVADLLLLPALILVLMRRSGRR